MRNVTADALAEQSQAREPLRSVLSKDLFKSEYLPSHHLSLLSFRSWFSRSPVPMSDIYLDPEMNGISMLVPPIVLGDSFDPISIRVRQRRTRFIFVFRAVYCITRKYIR